MKVKGEMVKCEERNNSHDITPLLRSDVHGTREFWINILFAKSKEFGSRKER